MNYNFIIVDGYIIGSFGWRSDSMPTDIQFAGNYLMATASEATASEEDNGGEDEEHENWSYFSMNDINMRLIFKDDGDAADTIDTAEDMSTLFGGSSEQK